MSFIERVDHLLKEKGEEFSGVVLITQNGKELYSAALGYANRPWSVKNRMDTRFRVASVSKMFTAIATLKLIELGKFAFDTSITTVLNLPESSIPETVTVYHLLTMTSGIADWFDESGDWEETWRTFIRNNPIYLLRRNEDYLPLFANSPPVAPVGEKHRYNNASYILLGLLIERVSGMSYFDYIRQHIFEPAQMTRSDFVPLESVESEIAEGYVPVMDEQGAQTSWKKNIYLVTPEAAADGGATSTAHDLYRFAIALREGRLLSAEMTQAMLTPKVLEDDEPYRGYTWKYGYGNFFLTDQAVEGQDAPIVRWGHTGEEDGISCRLYCYPQQDVDVVVLGNQSGCAVELAWDLHDLVVKNV
ncbi:MAG: serine hydrolase domain-containing protein [Cyanobacteria bacterium J06573_11]